MDNSEFDDETLMAYADGELDNETAHRLESALREDAVLSARLDVFTGTRDAIADLAADARTAPVPDALNARLQETLEAARRADEDNTVVPFAARVPARRPLFRPAAIAAGFAAVGLVVGLLAAPEAQAPGQGNLQFAILDGPGLTEALDQLPSGERVAIPGGEVEMIASFVGADTALCREFEVDRPDSATTVVAVACQSDTGWTPRFAVVGAMDDGTNFAPASSFEALNAYLSAIGAGSPLDAEDEAAMLAATRR